MDGQPVNGPAARSHWIPRTAQGRALVFLFLALFALAEPPLVYALANRIEPRILAMPFLYVYLLVVYIAMIAVLIVAQRRRIG